MACFGHAIHRTSTAVPPGAVHHPLVLQNNIWGIQTCAGIALNTLWKCVNIPADLALSTLFILVILLTPLSVENCVVNVSAVGILHFLGWMAAFGTAYPHAIWRLKMKHALKRVCVHASFLHKIKEAFSHKELLMHPFRKKASWQYCGALVYGLPWPYLYGLLWFKLLARLFAVSVHKRSKFLCLALYYERSPESRCYQSGINWS